MYNHALGQGMVDNLTKKIDKYLLNLDNWECERCFFMKSSGCLLVKVGRIVELGFLQVSIM